MKTIVFKLFHDFRLNKTKFLLCVIAAGLSSWGISSAFYSYSLANRDFTENFAATHPSDLAITITHATDSVVQAILSLPEVEGIERREALVGRIRAYNSWMPVTLFAVENFDRLKYNSFRLVETNSPSFGGIYIEQNAAIFLDGSDEKAIIRFAGSDSIVLKKSGTIHDPGLAPAQMERVVYAYTDLKTAATLIKSGTRRLLIKTNFKKPTQRDLNEFGEKLSAQIKQAGGEVITTTVPAWGEHPHQGIVDGIAFLQKSFGAVLSILGIVLLSLILLTWIFPQLPQVGIMKALGASTQSIVGAYLIVLVIILLLGLSMGIPLGYLSAKGYNRFIAMIQNFTVVDSLLPIGNHLVVIIVCLAVPLLFSVSILTRIGRTSVNNAISQTFRSSANYWFTLTQRLIPASKHKYAVNNLWRNYQRSLLMILLLSIGIALFFTGRNLEHSIKTDFKNNLAYLDYGVLVSLGGLQTKNMDFLDSLAYINKQASVLAEMVQYESLHKGYDESTLLLNFPSDYQFKKELLLEGTLQPDCMDCFYVNQRLLDDFKNVALGKQVKFTRKDGSTTFYKYAGIIKDLAGSGMYRFSNEFMTSYNLQAIDIPSDSLRDETLDQIEKQIKAHGMDVSRISTSREMMAGLENHLAPTYKVVQYMGIFTATVALLGLLMVLSLSIQERISEIGILKSMGCNSSKIISLFRLEFLILNLIAITTGMILTFLVTHQLCAVYGKGLLGIGFTPAFDWPAIAASIITIVTIQAVSVTLYCRYKISRTSRELIADFG